MTEKYIHRLCPCAKWDIEGIQTWLEDMAEKGWHLDPDGGFLGIFSFLEGQPQPVRYRLTPAKEKRGFFDETDLPEPEEREYSAACGWEYVLKYGTFHIYRATDPGARPLHTDPRVHALALKALSKQQGSALLSQVLFWAIWLGLRGARTLSIFRAAAVIGPLFLLSVTGLFAWAIGSMAVFFIRLVQYRKRLLRGDPLERRRPWRKKAPAVLAGKLLPFVLAVTLLAGAGQAWKMSYERMPLEEISKDFPGVTDLFPGQEPERMSMGDYNTGISYRNPLSENTEWNESCAVGGYHCILRIQAHKLRWEWLAEGLAEDFYRYERFRYRGKRFEDLPAPETELDSLRVFQSYGITHVLIRHGDVVIDAVVNISTPEQQNRWDLWLQKAEQMLLRG